MNERDCLRRIFDAAITSALPEHVVMANLPDKPTGRCVVVGAGKASAAMAAAVDAAWPDVELSGVVVTRYGHAVNAGRIQVLEASHPVPDAASVTGANALLAAVGDLREDDLVLALISGGGSATCALPMTGISLAEKQSVTDALLHCGASISEINTVRIHLSGIKGGRLAAAARPAAVHTLLISDVPGDAPSIIASGPTIPVSSSGEAALAIIDRYGIDIDTVVREVLNASTLVPRPDSRDRVVMAASPAQALRAAAEACRTEGFTPVILGDDIECESAELGRAMAGMARSVRKFDQPAAAPVALLSGGETCVSVGSEGAGRGGRNTEFALALAIALDGEPGVFALAGDTDGIDGTEDAAGALVTPDTLSRLHAAGVNARQALDGHDSYTAFAAIDDLVMTGPTLTNVNDLRVVLVV